MFKKIGLSTLILLGSLNSAYAEPGTAYQESIEFSYNPDVNECDDVVYTHLGSNIWKKSKVEKMSDGVPVIISVDCFVGDENFAKDSPNAYMGPCLPRD